MNRCQHDCVKWLSQRPRSPCQTDAQSYLRTAQAFSFGIANSGGRYEICYCANYDTSERTRRERSYFELWVRRLELGRSSARAGRTATTQHLAPILPATVTQNSRTVRVH